MAVRLRLRRAGRRHYSFFHIVAADSRAPRDGAFIEKIGYYDPNKNPALIQVDHDRALYWLMRGAQPTETVRSLLSRSGVLLKLHLMRKGKSPEEIAQAYAAWQSQKAAKAAR
ncbi:MAG: 30S ribosomal protein S16 [Bacteroidia bacterium]